MTRRGGSRQMGSNDCRDRLAGHPAAIAAECGEMSPLLEARQQGPVLALAQTRQLPVGLHRVIGDFMTTGKTSCEHSVRGVAIEERLKACPSQVDRDRAAPRVVR